MSSIPGVKTRWMWYHVDRVDWSARTVWETGHMSEYRKEVFAMNIAIAGIGYVGLANALLLARHHRVRALDIDPKRIRMVNERVPPLADADMERFFTEEALDLHATDDPASAFSGADFVLIATPTNYDPERNTFDTSSIEVVARKVLCIAPKAVMVIKSTVPVGYTEDLRARLGTDRILFSPEFLREGRALHGNLHPSRIIVGERSERARRFAGLLQEAAEEENVPVLFTGSTEAEAIKLFSNTYLAM